jgi:hypothetical protein
MAALQTADPGVQLSQIRIKFASLPKNPLPPTTSSLGTAMMMPFWNVYGV